MFCPKCGKINSDTMEKCSGCGAVLKEEAPATCEKKSKKGIVTAIIAVAVIAAIVVAVVLLTGCDASTAPDLNDSMNY